MPAERRRCRSLSEGCEARCGGRGSSASACRSPPSRDGTSRQSCVQTQAFHGAEAVLVPPSLVSPDVEPSSCTVVLCRSGPGQMRTEAADVTALAISWRMDAPLGAKQAIRPLGGLHTVEAHDCDPALVSGLLGRVGFQESRAGCGWGQSVSRRTTTIFRKRACADGRW